MNATTGDPILAPGLDPEGLNGIQDWSHVGTHTADLFTQLTTSFNEHWSLRAAANADVHDLGVVRPEGQPSRGGGGEVVQPTANVPGPEWAVSVY